MTRIYWIRCVCVVHLTKYYINHVAFISLSYCSLSFMLSIFISKCSLSFMHFVLQEFDAFVSYHHQDSEWVRQELRPHMEDVEPRFRLCLHQRDFVAGATVSDNICSAVDISRRMILLLSKAFLQSHWCHEEFRQAHYKVMGISIWIFKNLYYPRLSITHIENRFDYLKVSTFSSFEQPLTPTHYPNVLI